MNRLQQIFQWILGNAPNQNEVAVSSELTTVEESLDTKKYKLLIEYDRERQIHLLTHTYFKKRHRYFLFIPSIIMSAMSSIFAVVAALDNCSPRGVFCSSTVCICSIITVAILHTDYGVKSEIHSSVAFEMETLINNLENIRLEDDLKRIQEVHQSVLKKCRSHIPSSIAHAFGSTSWTIEQVVLVLYQNHFQKEEERRCVYRAIYNNLASEISKSPSWPLFHMELDDAVKRAVDGFVPPPIPTP